MNRITVTGYLSLSTREMPAVTTRNGRDYLQVGIVSDTGHYRKDGTKKQIYFNTQFWGPAAKWVAKMGQQGSYLTIMGEMESVTLESGGKNSYFWNLVVNPNSGGFVDFGSYKQPETEKKRENPRQESRAPRRDFTTRQRPKQRQNVPPVDEWPPVDNQAPALSQGDEWPPVDPYLGF